VEVNRELTYNPVLLMIFYRLDSKKRSMNNEHVILKYALIVDE